MSDNIDIDRRQFLGAAALTLAGIHTSSASNSASQSHKAPARTPAPSRWFDVVKQIDAGSLNVGYAEVGPANGPTVMLLHGWPYDIQSYAEVAPLLIAKGYRVIVPYLR